MFVKKYLHKVIFGQTKLYKNNFTSRVWWALIEEIALRAEEKRRQLVVLEATTYTRIHGQQQFGKCWCVVVRKIFIVKLYA